MKLFALLIVLFCFGDTYPSLSCQTLDGKRGVCQFYGLCPRIVDILNRVQNRQHVYPQELMLVRGANCGKPGTRNVCCPLAQCYTPDGQEGDCLSYLQCPSIHNSSAKFIQNSRCLSDGRTEKYCCGKHPPKPASKVDCVHSMTALPLDLETGCCGLDYGESRIYGGDIVELGQHPWAVIIKYADNRINEKCGGTLISNKYVLTAAHCVHETKSNRAVSVVLGENDLTTDPDCDYVGDLKDCADKAVTYHIEEIITHPSYNPTDSTYNHDIALIRLTNPARYTDFIRPICLPTRTEDVTKAPPANFMMSALGWGFYKAEQAMNSNVKRIVKLPLVDKTACMQAYSLLRRRRQQQHVIHETQLCAGGQIGKDSCGGDSGGPILSFLDGVWQILGIISYGPRDCGTTTPGVYTNVFDYNIWIRNNIRL